MIKKAKVIREDVKERHTSHWDLDYLSREELERLMTKKPAHDENRAGKGKNKKKHSTDRSDDDAEDEQSPDLKE